MEIYKIYSNIISKPHAIKTYRKLIKYYTDRNISFSEDFNYLLDEKFKNSDISEESSGNDSEMSGLDS